MRTRAYRPEVSDCLEDRSLLSGFTGLSADPVVLPRRTLDFVFDHMRQGFILFGRYHDFTQLQGEMTDVMGWIPFAQVDGLGISIQRILNRMQHDFFAHVPHTWSSARHEVIAVTNAEVEARVRAGDVVVR